MKIGIVITCCNEVQYTKNAVASIKTSHPYELIIVDDYSIDGTKDWLKQLPNEMNNVTPVIDPDTNSLGEKWNLGAQLSKDKGCEAVLICNNDILFNPATIDSLIERLQEAKDKDQNVVITTACNQRGNMKPNDIFTHVPPKHYSESEGPDFSCFLMDIKAWEYVGKFSDEYRPCYFEDNDFHTRLKLHGLSALAITSAPYYHFGSVTQNSVEGGLCKSPQFEYNRAVFVKKFDATPDKINIVSLRNKYNITPVSSYSAMG